MFHIRLARFPLRQKDVTNLDGSTLLDVFVNPWLAGDPIIWDGRRYAASNTKLTIYEGPALTTFQNGFGAWLKVVELGEDVTDALLVRRDFGIAKPVTEGVVVADGHTGPSPRPAMGSLASQRRLTGLDRSAREVVLQRLAEASVPPHVVLSGLLRASAVSGIQDYLQAIAELWGSDISNEVSAAMEEFVAARVNHGRLDWERAAPDAWRAHSPAGLLLVMPEPDFLTAVELAVSAAPDPRHRAGVLAGVINQVCDRRGVHYRLAGLPPRFEWTSDPETLRAVIAPALEALADARLAAGAGVEYASARAELRVGTPSARKQAIVEACNAVESTMRVVAGQHELAMTGKEPAQKLFELLRDNKIVDAATETLVLAPARFGNRRGRHGAGDEAHDVSVDEAEAVVRAAGVAISFLAQRLPTA